MWNSTMFGSLAVVVAAAVAVAVPVVATFVGGVVSVPVDVAEAVAVATSSLGSVAFTGAGAGVSKVGTFPSATSMSAWSHVAWSPWSTVPAQSAGVGASAFASAASSVWAPVV